MTHMYYIVKPHDWLTGWLTDKSQEIPNGLQWKLTQSFHLEASTFLSVSAMFVIFAGFSYRMFKCPIVLLSIRHQCFSLLSWLTFSSNEGPFSMQCFRWSKGYGGRAVRERGRRAKPQVQLGEIGMRRVQRISPSLTYNLEVI